MEGNDWRKDFIKHNKQKSNFGAFVGLSILVALIVLNLIFNWTDKINNDEDIKPYDNRGVYLDN